jgi:hypothetical protein
VIRHQLKDGEYYLPLSTWVPDPTGPDWKAWFVPVMWLAEQREASLRRQVAEQTRDR